MAKIVSKAATLRKRKCDYKTGKEQPLDRGELPQNNTSDISDSVFINGSYSVVAVIV